MRSSPGGSRDSGDSNHTRFSRPAGKVLETIRDHHRVPRGPSFQPIYARRPWRVVPLVRQGDLEFGGLGFQPGRPAPRTGLEVQPVERGWRYRPGAGPGTKGTRDPGRTRLSTPTCAPTLKHPSSDYTPPARRPWRVVPLVRQGDLEFGGLGFQPGRPAPRVPARRTELDVQPRVPARRTGLDVRPPEFQPVERGWRYRPGAGPGTRGTRDPGRRARLSTPTCAPTLKHPSWTTPSSTQALEGRAPAPRTGLEVQPVERGWRYRPGAGPGTKGTRDPGRTRLSTPTCAPTLKHPSSDYTLQHAGPGGSCPCLDVRPPEFQPVERSWTYSPGFQPVERGWACGPPIPARRTGLDVRPPEFQPVERGWRYRPGAGPGTRGTRHPGRRTRLSTPTCAPTLKHPSSDYTLQHAGPGGSCPWYAGYRLREHLDNVHHVRNGKERKLLLAFASGRFSVNGMACCIDGCQYHGPRVAEHLQNAHRDLSRRRKARMLKRLQWRRFVEQVRRLRASNPTPPLATELDLSDEGEESGPRCEGRGQPTSSAHPDQTAAAVDVGRRADTGATEVRRAGVPGTSPASPGPSIAGRTPIPLPWRPAPAAPPTLLVMPWRATADKEQGSSPQPGPDGRPRRAAPGGSCPPGRPNGHHDRGGLPAPAGFIEALRTAQGSSPPSDRDAPSWRAAAGGSCPPGQDAAPQNGGGLPAPYASPPSWPAVPEDDPPSSPTWSLPCGQPNRTITISSSSESSPERSLPDGQPTGAAAADLREETHRTADRPVGGTSVTLPETIGCYLDEFAEFLMSVGLSRKHKENTVSKVGRVQAFLTHMAGGKTELSSWLFLHDPVRVVEWPCRLLREGRAITTVKVYLTNTSQFITYFTETPPEDSALGATQLIALSRAIRAATHKISAGVVLRQLHVKHQKVTRAVTPGVLRRCVSATKELIPGLLRSLSEKSCDATQRHLFIGAFSLLITCLYGHRAGVMTHLKVEEMDEAKREFNPGDPGYVLNIQHHKTNRAFGHAQVFLTAEEFGWLEAWMQIRARLQPTCDLVFFNTNGRMIEKLSKFTRAAWRELGMPGSPSLTDLRTAVATMARDSQTSEVRKEMARLMCHDTSTADRFYALHMNARQLAALRQKFDRARECPL
ncbi:PREDICTED: uncharacterized protein LOC106910487 [Poecilia mexicana]|uniref:uncharacterized protein LOC106910487 n=1 Tax=Poecilia mexicana TaxID=48701 RepID=UPI00072E71F8|nr:PREDICTED: uncharacterized protein LOC106910487 [Poecilia mexicana]